MTRQYYLNKKFLSIQLLNKNNIGFRQILTCRMDLQMHTWRDVKQGRRYSSSEDKDELHVVAFSNSF